MKKKLGEIKNWIAGKDKATKTIIGGNFNGTTEKEREWKEADNGEKLKVEKVKG